MRQKQMKSYMMVLAATGIITVGCSGTQKGIYLEPGNQVRSFALTFPELNE